MADCLQLKKSNCKNCHKCIRHCPVKSIRFSSNQAQILSNECILCGQCVVECPQHAKEIKNDIGKVKGLLKSGLPVVVSLAPSFIANYDGVGIESMKNALKQLGFADVEETAIGATIVKKEYERLIREEKVDVLITSCCHSVNLLIQKYYPELLPYLADVLSPMQAHCKDIKRRNPQTKTVFIGPCLSKKDESESCPELVDAALTFEELTEMLSEAEINLQQQVDENENSKARIFPTTGGVLATLTERNPEYTYMAVDGAEQCRYILEDIASGNVHKCVIEMSSCIGSCINGPAMEHTTKQPMQNYLKVSKYAGRNDFIVDQPEAPTLRKIMNPIDRLVRIPSEEEIVAALASFGKHSPKDELNCGSCGYNSCRDKAIAVCQGKAETSMCLPYLKEKAENFSDHVVENDPSGIVVTNEDLEIQLINVAAAKMFGIEHEEDAIGEKITNYMYPDLYLDALVEKKIAREECLFLEQHNIYVDVSVAYDSETMQLFSFITDITGKVLDRQKHASQTEQTAEVADRVVEKQMRIVQEIASLLGETAAETKIALSKLKESIKDE